MSRGEVRQFAAVPPNPSIERTSKRLRLFAAAHVERSASQMKRLDMPTP
jgi:hypothetical protein